MKTFTVRGGHTVIVDDEDYERLCRLKASWSCLCAPQRSGHTMYYVRSGLYGMLHRYLLGVTSEMRVDHIDGNGLNNTRQNLRIVTAQQNNQNKAKAFSRNGFATTSQYKGVCRPLQVTRNGDIPGKSCIATIKPNRHSRIEYLGTFQTEALAAYVYDLAASVYFGVYARLNNPDIPSLVTELVEAGFFVGRKMPQKLSSDAN